MFARFFRPEKIKPVPREPHMKAIDRLRQWVSDPGYFAPISPAEGEEIIKEFERLRGDA